MKASEEFRSFLFVVLFFITALISRYIPSIGVLNKITFLIVFAVLFYIILFFTPIKNLKIWEHNLYTKYFKDHTIAKRAINSSIFCFTIFSFNKLDYMAALGIGFLVVGLLIPLFSDRLIEK